MFTHVYPLTDIHFDNFDASELKGIIGLFGKDAQFVESEDWLNMTPMTPNRWGKKHVGGRKYAVIKGETAGYPVEMFIGERFGVVASNHKGAEEAPSYFLIADFKLPFWIKNAQLSPHGLPFHSGVKLRGEFNEYFTIRMAKSEEKAIEHLIPKNTLTYILKNIPNVYIEYIENRIIVKAPLHLSSRGSYAGGKVQLAETHEHFFDMMKKILSSIEVLAKSASNAQADKNNYKKLKSLKWVMETLIVITGILVFIWISHIDTESGRLWAFYGSGFGMVGIFVSKYVFQAKRQKKIADLYKYSPAVKNTSNLPFP
jgi:hypothetical protein